MSKCIDDKDKCTVTFPNVAARQIIDDSGKDKERLLTLISFFFPTYASLIGYYQIDDQKNTRPPWSVAPLSHSLPKEFLDDFPGVEKYKIVTDYYTAKLMGYHKTPETTDVRIEYNKSSKTFDNVVVTYKKTQTLFSELQTIHDEGEKVILLSNKDHIECEENARKIAQHSLESFEKKMQEPLDGVHDKSSEKRDTTQKLPTKNEKNDPNSKGKQAAMPWIDDVD